MESTSKPHKNIKVLKVEEPSPKQRIHTHTHLDKTDCTFCAKFMIMNVPCRFETTAFQGQKENRTKEQSFNITSMKFFWQVRWIDQIQYPISLVASLDTVPVICCAPLLRLYLSQNGYIHTHTHTHTLSHFHTETTKNKLDFA